MGILVEAGALSALETPYLAEVCANFPESLVNNVTHTDHSVYGFPMSINTQFLYYNKAVYSEEDVKSLDTMLEKGVVAFPMNNSWYNASFFLGAGGTIFGEKSNDADAGIQFTSVDAASYMVELAAHSNFRNDVDSIGSTGMMDGTISAIFSGSWDYAALYEALGKDLGVAMMPAFTTNGTDYQMKSFATCTALGVNPNSKQKDLALELVTFLSTADSQLVRYADSGVMPTAVACAKAEQILKDPLACAALNQVIHAAVAQPSIAEMANYWDPMVQFGQKILDNNITADNVAEAVESLMTSLNGG